MEYEFTAVLSLDKDSYLYTSSKDRTQIFEGKHEKLSQETGKKIMDWLESGKSIEESEKEEILELREKLIGCTTLELLRNAFKLAREKYPNESDGFLKIANERSELLKAEGGMVS